ncbi:MAG: GntR family transcriptional regulator [Azospirillaceae bacterium]
MTPSAIDLSFLTLDQPESLAEQAHARLEHMIVTLDIEPGARLTEQALCAMLDLGRTPVREAILKLEHDQLIEIRPRSGIRVTPVSMSQHLQTTELRFVIEELIVRRATKLAEPIERQQLRRLATEMQRAAREGKLERFMAIDDAFNRFEAKLARNVPAARAIAPLHSLARRFGALHFRTFGKSRLIGSADQHARLMTNIAAGDEKGAVEALAELFTYSNELAMELIGATGEANDSPAPRASKRQSTARGAQR